MMASQSDLVDLDSLDYEDRGERMLVWWDLRESPYTDEEIDAFIRDPYFYMILYLGFRHLNGE